MFLRIGVRNEDQHTQRFFWRDGNPNKPLDTYIMRVLTFGATCSPSCAQFVKNTNARKFSSDYPRAVESVIKNHYVDDLLDSMDDEKSAIEIAKQVAYIHSQANFEIRNWRSNSQILMKTMNRSSQSPEEIDMNMDSEATTEKVLGMWWNLNTDCLVFSLKYNKGNKEVLQGKKGLQNIRSEDTRKLCKFVAHRVAEIQDISLISNWHYVPTKLNVADEATKWTKRPSLKATDRWFVGPEFLYSKRQLWPMEEPDEKQCAQQTVSIHETQTFLLNITNFSSYNKLLYTVGYVHKFVNLMRKTYQARTTGILNSEELKQAENTLIRIVQKEFYHEEIKTLKNSSTTKLQPTVKSTSKIYKLSPYLDEYGILRVRGRIDVSNRIEVNAKRPIILPRESHLTTLIIRKYHITFQHKNHESVFNEMRQKYYIPKLRRTLNKIRKNCQTCIINSAVPAIPEMSPLPVCRLATFISPFTHTGVDYFGPMNVMIGRRTEKRWGALFTCLTTRAVHIEVAHKLDHDNCILCFKNFMNRRGTPRHIYCDRGTNFVATERVLREELQKLKTKMIAESFISPELSFHFNPPLSPHMGGAWERLVKSIKIALYDALPTRNPTDPLLRSCLIAAENIVNSRPLTYLPLDSEESEALTPNHFLVGSSNGDKPIVDLDVNAKILKFSFLYREQFANKCWRRFVAEYIPDLLLRSKWFKPVRPLQKDDIVVICDKDLPRCNWPKGKVIEIKVSRDGQVRKASVQTSAGIFERPVAKLGLLCVDKSKDGTPFHFESAVPGGSVRNNH
ncbi:uncharacterized protein [Leptinotarsa decemlineata]|uniref:uncharacterized protein n=1 Tax=Leptinotarsa decemlineata TaxID=7539 RepID=UPI003D304BCC